MNGFRDEAEGINTFEAILDKAGFVIGAKLMTSETFERTELKVYKDRFGNVMLRRVQNKEK